MASPRLVIDGEVERARALSIEDLSSFAEDRQISDVSAIEPTRRGRGVWLSGLLQAVGAKPSATHVTLHASADDFHASGPLPASAGGPFRFFIRDHAACQTAEVDECANVKFVDRIELTAGPGRDNRPRDEAEHAKLHGK